MVNDRIKISQAGQRCVYCGRQATSRDHVPAKCLLERPLPAKSITVPSCRACNEGLSKDEEYFGVFLAHVGLSTKLTAKVYPDGVVDRALTRNPNFSERIENALRIDELTGRVYITPEIDRLERVVRKIAMGLYAYRYLLSTIPADSFHVRLVGREGDRNAEPPREILLMSHNERFVPKRWRVVQDEVFSYTFVRAGWKPTQLHCLMNFYDSVWADVECPSPTFNRKTSRVRTKFRTRRENANQLSLEFKRFV